MSEEIRYERRRFIGTVATALAAAMRQRLTRYEQQKAYREVP